MAFILRSPFGRTMIAIRENERRARFLGIPVERHIWIAFTLSCFFMGFAGALYALVNNFADPRGLHYSQSGDFVMMAVMGGMRSFWGPLLGAAVFVVLQDYLSSITVNWMSFVGLLFVAGRAVLPARAARLPASGARHERSRDQQRHQAVRQPGRRARRIAERREGRTVRHHRPERRRQDHLLQPDQRIFPADLRLDHRSTAATSPGCPTHERVTRGMARTFQITEIFPGTHRVRKRPHRRGSRRRASGCGPGSAAPRHAQVHRTRRRDARSWSRWKPRPTGWSANSPTATSAPPRSPWRWR